MKDPKRSYFSRLMSQGSASPLATTFFAGGIWDTIAGFLYIFVIGNGRIIDNPPIDPFYAVFLGSFFLCFAFLQIFGALDIRKYSFCIGCLIFGRMFYVIVLFSFMIFSKDFPSHFWFTGLIDSGLIVFYLIFSARAKIEWKKLFIPQLN